LIRQRVQDPVKARLRTLSNDRDVEIGERFQNLDQILHTPASASPAEGRRRFGARDADPQEGGPFFGTLLKWYMRVDDPVSPPAEVAREK
jgi:hypothetical protein